ncbi:unnamed protein product [Umbelopsis ramanniana]
MEPHPSGSSSICSAETEGSVADHPILANPVLVPDGDEIGADGSYDIPMGKSNSLGCLVITSEIRPPKGITEEMIMLLEGNHRKCIGMVSIEGFKT